MADDDVYQSLIQYLPTLAKQHIPPPTNDNSKQLQSQLHLPGQDTPSKQALEKEISSLVARIQYLETKANKIPGNGPITPNEPDPSSFAPQNQTNIPVRSKSITDKSKSALLITQLLSKKENINCGDSSIKSSQRCLTEEQLQLLREHVDEQARQIQSQSEYIDKINDKLDQQQRATTEALGGIESSVGDVETLKREVQKNQQINMTYQKVLREIGNIITAVANGDLSKKVLISEKERDPEIETFKRTINRMVDQLQDFASQVTHLAKEVGTEGRLGGQAVLPGLDGIWAELTNNGQSFIHHICVLKYN